MVPVENFKPRLEEKHSVANSIEPVKRINFGTAFPMNSQNNYAFPAIFFII